MEGEGHFKVVNCRSSYSSGTSTCSIDCHFREDSYMWGENWGFRKVNFILLLDTVLSFVVDWPSFDAERLHVKQPRQLCLLKCFEVRCLVSASFGALTKSPQTQFLEFIQYIDSAHFQSALIPCLSSLFHPPLINAVPTCTCTQVRVSVLRVVRIEWGGWQTKQVLIQPQPYLNGKLNGKT